MKKFWVKRKDETPGDEVGPEKQTRSSRESNSHGASIPPDELSVSLRAEMLPASEISPDRGRSRLSRFNPLKLGAALGFILLLAFCWLFSVGPGRPVLERVLSGLAGEPRIEDVQVQSTATSTEAVKTEVAILPTNTVRVMNTPTRTPRPLPSATATILANTPTNEPSPTIESGCVDVLTVTLEDVGKTLCVRGVILNFEARSSGFLIAFSNQKGAMYWVSYDLVWEPAEEGLCIEATGEVMQIANSPVLIFGYQNLPSKCSDQ